MNSMVEARGKDAECFLVEPADGIVGIFTDNVDFIGKIDLQSVAQKNAQRGIMFGVVFTILMGGKTAR